MKFASPYNNPPKSSDFGIDFSNQVSMTEQHHARDCDINRIVSRYISTGELPVGRTDGQYVDVSMMTSYADALQVVEQAESLFSELPARVRDEYQNDPMLLMNAFSDPAQRDKLEALGLLTKTENHADATAAVDEVATAREPSP